ncbi:hypothetical protein Tco_0204593 [Tanacetum coccineum]
MVSILARKELFLARVVHSFEANATPVVLTSDTLEGRKVQSSCQRVAGLMSPTFLVAGAHPEAPVGGGRRWAETLEVELEEELTSPSQQHRLTTSSPVTSCNSAKDSSCLRPAISLFKLSNARIRIGSAVLMLMERWRW